LLREFIYLENIWIKHTFDEELKEKLKKDINLPNFVVDLLMRIGIKTKEEVQAFFHPTLKQIHNPMLMKDMEKAIKRINEAIEKKEKILFHGDYDCDGVTTTAVAVKAFRLLGVKIDTFLPHRKKDGYGLNPRNMERFAREYDLIITGDTGIRAFEGAAKVKEIGHADLIITDHHEPYIKSTKYLSEAYKDSDIEIFGDTYISTPYAYAVIDPKRLGDEHPCKTHAGVGVIFKTMLALFKYRNEPIQPLLDMLDLVATGTIVDLAQQIDSHHEQLDFEVRVMCAAGIQLMNERPPLWVSALQEVSNQTGKEVTSETLGFTIGPIINAVGRLYDATPALKFVLEEDIDASLAQANELKAINQERKEQTKVAFQLIEEMKTSEDTTQFDYGITVHSELYEEGIAGLVAEKLKSNFYRPAIALTTAQKDGKTIYKGSARSIDSIHVLDMLDEVQREIGPFVYGGHEQAAGLSIMPEQLEAFQKAFRKACMAHDDETFIPRFYYHSEVEIPDITHQFMNILSRFEPYGEANKKPVFRLSNVAISNVYPHKNGKGFNMILKSRQPMKAMSFDLYESFSPAYKQALAQTKGDVLVDLLFKPTYNEYQGETKIQLNIEDFKFPSLQES